MQIIYDLITFALETLIIVFAVGGLILLVAFVVSRNQQKSELEVEVVNQKWKNVELLLQQLTLGKKDLKEKRKKEKKKKNADEPGNKLFVLNFSGDVKATQVDQLREEISAVLTLATPQDEVLIKVESPGGVVHGYGLCASQILRLREKKIPVIVAVDKVAASGGYLMASVADRILAAPFAIVGSIGVVAQVPNFHKLLKRNNIDYHEYTAGAYKRTVSLFGEITERGEAKFKDQLEQTHDLFKSFVHRYRPNMNLDAIATGEYWYGEQAQKLGLIDTIQTSDDYVLSQLSTRKVLTLQFEKKQKFSDRLSQWLGSTAEVLWDRIFSKSQKPPLGL